MSINKAGNLYPHAVGNPDPQVIFKVNYSAKNKVFLRMKCLNKKLINGTIYKLICEQAPP